MAKLCLFAVATYKIHDVNTNQNFETEAHNKKETEMTKFQERVKKFRQEKGITQIELAKAIEVTNDTISLW